MKEIQQLGEAIQNLGTEIVQALGIEKFANWLEKKLLAMKKINPDIDWMKELKSHNAMPYIKTNRNTHDSGFHCFETGYCIIGKDNKVKWKKVLSTWSDHIWMYDYTTRSERVLSGMGTETNILHDLNMDVTLDGYIRLFSHENILWWGSLDWVVSSATLEVLCRFERGLK